VKEGLTALDSQTILGTTIGFPSVRGMTIGSGDFSRRRKRMLRLKWLSWDQRWLPHYLVRADPVGQYIIVGNNVRLTVIGVFASKGSVGGVDFDSRMYIPITVLF